MYIEPQANLRLKLQIIKVYSGGYGCNSYIVTEDGKNAVVIDCASPEVYDECIERNLKPVAVLLTHGHYDHVSGCSKFYENGVPVYCGESEKDLIFSGGYLSLCTWLNIPKFEIHKALKDGEEITLGGITFKTIATPGHTAGSVCYIAENNIFSGDTLFFKSVGRCDLPTGNTKQLSDSLKKLLSLDGDYKVYCGHSSETTLGFERKFNPYIN